MAIKDESSIVEQNILALVERLEEVMEDDDEEQESPAGSEPGNST